MATEPTVVFPEADVYRYAIYTGDNSADLNSLISDFTITGETPAGLDFTSGGTAYSVPPGGYVVYQNGVVTNVYLNADDLHDNFTGVVSAAEHYHELVLKSGPALAGSGEA
jgi:hypothetical protein